MNLDHYELTQKDSLFIYEFYSDGPKGKVKKVIRFGLTNADGNSYFNLSFGDWNEEKGKIDDLIITNNKDWQKVLATVAMAVVNFMERFPDMSVYARGSTFSRTRLYQIAIQSNWAKIEPLYILNGFLNKNWEPFKKNVNYEAFFIRRK